MRIPEPVEEKLLRETVEFHPSLIADGAGEAEAFLLSLPTIPFPFLIFSFHPPYSTRFLPWSHLLGLSFPAICLHI